MLSKNGLYVYAINPWDSGWELLPSLADHALALTKRNFSDSYHSLEDRPRAAGGELIEFGNLIEKAFEAAKEADWDGDFREEPRVLVLPQPDTWRTALVWKQDDNGETFVVSELPLAYLEGQ